MSEYIECEATIKRIEEIPAHFNSSDIRYGIELAIQAIKAPPTADVVEVVRCKDCAHIKQSISPLCPETNCFICDNPYGLKANVNENDFCSYGERKDRND